MERVALLSGKNINKDSDISKLLQGLATSWVVEWLAVTTWQVAVWYAFIEVSRDGESFYVLYQNTSAVTIDTTGTKKVWIAVDQTKVDDGSNNSVDGSGIGSIQTWASYPASNYIPLASITGGVITDERSFFTPKVAEKIQKQSYTHNPSTWSANAYVLTLTPAPTAYASGQKFSFKANFGNTWSATLNVNWLWAKTIKKLWGTTVLTSWDIQNWQVVEFAYNWTDFEMVSPIGQIITPNILTLEKTWLTAWQAINARIAYRTWINWRWDCQFTPLSNYLATWDQDVFSSNSLWWQTINEIHLPLYTTWWAGTRTLKLYNWWVLLWTSVWISNATWASPYPDERVFVFSWWVSIADWVTVTVKLNSTTSYNWVVWNYCLVKSTEDTTRKYKTLTNSYIKWRVEWIAKDDVTLWWTFVWVEWWVVSWFSSLTSWLDVYVKTDYSIWHNSWVYPVKVWQAISTTEVLLDFDNFKIQAGTSETFLRDRIWESTSTTSYLKMKQWAIPASWTYTVSFTCIAGWSATWKVRIYKNGVAYWTERTISASVVSFSENLAFLGGDTCEIWVNNTSWTTTLYDFIIQWEKVDATIDHNFTLS